MDAGIGSGEFLPTELRKKIEHQLEFLNEEQKRVKMVINGSGFDCTTAPFILAKQYRDAIKEHMKILRMNLDD